MKSKKEKKHNTNSWIFLLLICIATCFMSMGYAAIDSIKSEISGTLLAQAQDGIFITDAIYSSDVNAELANSEIKQFYQTMLESTVTLSDTDINSSITYTITIYNSSAQDYYFAETKYVDDFYDNANIKFELTGLNIGDILKSKESVTFDITFLYAVDVIPEIRTLNSYIKFSFENTYNVTYANIDNSGSEYPSQVFVGETLQIDLSENYSTLYAKVKMNNVDIDNYTYDRGILTVENVTGDLEIRTQERFDKESTILIGNEKVVVPGGGAISQISKEYESVDAGIVMYVLPEGTEGVDWTGDSNSNGIKDVQEDYDQFVWIPVNNAILDLSSNSAALASDSTIKSAVQSEINAGRYPMAIKSTDGNYLGVLYQFALSSSTVNISPLAGWSPKAESDTGYREPDSITDYDDDTTNLAQINGILSNVSLSDANSFKARLQQQYNTMVGEVDANGGFWVGRYETSGLTDYTDETQNKIKVETKRGKTEGLHTATWYRMYAEQELYSSKAGISFESSMIWGSQYDQIMIWMKDFDNTSQGSKFIVNSIGMANLGAFSGINDGWSDSGPAPTGYLDTYKANNIYDISGNAYEWEIGAYSNNARSKRGGYFDVAEWLSDYARADARHYTRSNYSGNVNGTRMVIY